MITLQLLPSWVMALVIAWCMYQGIRGALEHQLVTAGKNGIAENWNWWQRWIVLYVHDFAFRFLCTAAGFIALYLVAKFGSDFIDSASPNSSEVTLLIFLSLIGLVGVGGQLHYVILLGKVPKV